VGRPRVALTTPVATSESETYARYRLALERAGADVVEVHPGDALPADIDGLCLSGGGDVEPRRYGAEYEGTERESVKPERDELEFTILEHALARDLPVLAICRGFQVLNVQLHGALVQDVSGHRATDHTTHTVRAASGSRLARACGDAPMRVNSRHHQAVTRRELAPGLVPTALVDDLVEAFESDAHRWVVGVQWHPERVRADDEPVDENAARIFGAFVAEASRAPIRP